MIGEPLLDSAIKSRRKIMKIKRSIVLASVILTLSPVALGTIDVMKVSADELAIVEKPTKTFTYEESLELPTADLNLNLKTDGNISNSTISTMAVSNAKKPSSFADYRKLGYRNIQYTNWTGYKKVMSTKSKRITTFVATNLLAFIPSNSVKAVIGIYDLTSTMKTQNPDVWPSVNTRNIVAISPVGTHVLIGQETIVKYYGNSARTKLLKTVRKTYWL